MLPNRIILVVLLDLGRRLDKVVQQHRHRYLEEDPLDDEAVAAHVGDDAEVHRAVLVELAQARDPGVAREYLEERHEAPVEPREVLRVRVSEEAHPDDRVDADDDEHESEGVEDGDDGLGEGSDDLLHRLDLAEEPDDSEGAEQADDAAGDRQGPEGEEGHADDDEVESAPPVADESGPEVARHVDEQLEGEERDEDVVGEVEEAGEGRGPPAVVCEAGVQLRLDDAQREVQYDQCTDEPLHPVG
mmetsp:Transcript_43155/g.90333  ORF Transcript_43155/g.90333 Transcript_43155/m.90333 type:complete len:245 (-) Transcript_43155:707-1441(-)